MPDISNKNLGFLYTRCYYEGIEGKEKVNKKDRNENPEPILDNKDAANLFFQKKNNIIIEASKNQTLNYDYFPYNLDNDEHYKSFNLITTYPGMIPGIGILHKANLEGEVKFGLSFDHSTGLPIIPGSSVKGVLRSLFPYKDYVAAQKYEKNNKPQEAQFLYKKSIEKSLYIANQLKLKLKEDELTSTVFSIEHSIFDGIYKDSNGDIKAIDTSRRDVFFDAVIVGKRNAILGTDYITPHGKTIQEQLKDPVPVQFMRIEPGVTFKFCFRLFDSEINDIKIDVTSKLNLFKEILKTVGIGAKTNVGYGQLVEN